MDKLLLIVVGAALVVAAYFAVVVAKHGWSWVKAKLEAHAKAIEGAAQADFNKLAAPLIADIAAIKTKVGL
jgi:hypothetical protein